GWARFWAERIFPEPHSTKQIEDMTAWQLDSTAEINLLCEDAPTAFALTDEREALIRRVTCPLLVVGSDLDACQPPATAHQPTELAGAPLVKLTGVGHVAPARHPVKANLLISDFVRGLAPAVVSA